MHHRHLYMIGNGHIDPVWLWQWEEGFQEVKATFRSALDRMAEFDDFVFTASSAAFFEWVEENDPTMFTEIQQRVAEGRFELVGGWWIEPDCNIPGGESFVRQALYGQRYFAEKFGVMASVGFNPDSFGHNATLPQILKKSGLGYYVFMRPGPHEKDLPGHLFWWESRDGSRVLTFRILFTYATSWVKTDEHIQRHIEATSDDCPALMCFYGVGNHGGGPTIEAIRTIHQLNQDRAETLTLSRTSDFFAAVEAEGRAIPVARDDLQHHASGCYAAHSGVKRWNRQAENALITAEKLSVIAAQITGQPYPRAAFTRAWKNVLFNQFHDILAGTSLEEAYEDARNLYGASIATADHALNNAVQSLSWQIKVDPSPGMKPVVVFNPHPWQSRVNVELECRDLTGEETLVDDKDVAIPAQIVQSHGSARRCQRFTFTAGLPPLGYRVYRLLPPTAQAADGAALDASGTVLENAWLRLEIAPEIGHIGRLVDKRQGVDVFSRGAARAVVYADESDTWSHGVFRFDQEIGLFAPVSVKLVEQGPVKATLRVKSRYGASSLAQDFTIFADLDYVDVRVQVDWRERFKLLKLRFPVNVSHPQPTYAIPYGYLERPANGEEEPGQSWIDLTGRHPQTGSPYGVSVINNAKYSYDVTGDEIGLTVLRSPIYAHHIPIEPDLDRDYSFIDQGIQTFRYRLLPHADDWRAAGTERRALELNQGPISLIETFHPNGTLPQSASYLAVEPDNVVLGALKQADDGTDIILRCHETAGQTTDVTLHLPLWGHTIETTFAPGEIKSFRISADPDAAVREVDLLERPV